MSLYWAVLYSQYPKLNIYLVDYLIWFWLLLAPYRDILHKKFGFSDCTFWSFFFLSNAIETNCIVVSLLFNFYYLFFFYVILRALGKSPSCPSCCLYSYMRKKNLTVSAVLHNCYITYPHVPLFLWSTASKWLIWLEIRDLDNSFLPYLYFCIIVLTQL